MTLPGIDISNNQAKMPSLAGLSFVIHKATEGTGFTDRFYASRAKAIKKAGLAQGAYHFGRAGDGAAQARYFLKVAPTADFYALDDEKDMTQAQAEAFIAEMHAQGFKCGYYRSLGAWRNVGQDWNWVAWWGTPAPDIQTQYPRVPWTFWQPGGTHISGMDIDADVFNGDAATLGAFVAKQRPKALEGAIP